MAGITRMVDARSTLSIDDRLRRSETVGIFAVITDQLDRLTISDLQMPAGLVAHGAKIDAVEFGAFPDGLPPVQPAIAFGLAIDAQLRPFPAVAAQRDAVIAVDNSLCVLLRLQCQRLPG